MRLLTCLYSLITGLRDSGSSHVEQSGHIAQKVEWIFEEASRRETLTGTMMFMHLPDEAARIALQHHFDPYNHQLSRDALKKWLEHHIVFDPEGRMAVLHDNGVILWKAQDTNLRDLLKEG